MSFRTPFTAFLPVILMVLALSLTTSCQSAVTVEPTSHLKTASWSEFGREISLAYDTRLASGVEARSVPEVPISDQVMFAESRPAYAQFRFSGYQQGRSYQLPLLPEENNIAQVMIFRTADFPGYGDDLPQGFGSQLQALKDVLATGVDPARCAQPVQGDSGLPFLPWLNAQQALCSQPQILEFPGGKGVRYLTHYSQDPSPVLDQRIFYTFQGLTEDDQFYVSAVFPVETGIFPTEPPPCPKCGLPDYNPFPEWQALLQEQLTRLNAQPAEQFNPSLAVLDELIQTIEIKD
jgi:hypothetical protein